VAEDALHCFAPSGNAYKTALMLALAHADWSPRFVDYFAGETKTPACRAVNVIADWNADPKVRDWLARLGETPRWADPYEPMPGHPRPTLAPA